MGNRLNYIIIGMLLLILLGWYHEQVHVIIFNDYGIDAHVEYFSHFPDIVTVPDGDYFLCNSSCRLAHEMNEAISYPLIPIFLLIFFLGLLVLLELDFISKSLNTNYNYYYNKVKK